MSSEHPRVMLTPADVDRARALIDNEAWAEEVFDGTRERVAKLAETGIDALGWADLGPASEDAASAWALGGRDEDLDLARRALHAIRERFESPDLDLGFGIEHTRRRNRFVPGGYGHGTWVLRPMLAYELVAAALPDDERAQLRDELFYAVVAYFRRDKMGDGNFQMNINMAMTGMGLMFDDADLVEEAVNAPFGLIDQFGRGILDDGSFMEGTCRYSYAMAINMANCVRFALNGGVDLRYADLADRTGLNLLPGEKTLKLLFDIPLYRAFPGGREAALNDTSYWPAMPIHCAMWDMLWMAYRDPNYAAALTLAGRQSPERLKYPHAYFYRAPDLPQTEWTRTTKRFAPLGECIDGSSAFRENGQALLNGGDALSVYFKCGYWGGGHAHADSLTMCLATPRKMLAFDHGTIDGYGPIQRAYGQQTIAHNTITVDERSQAWWFTKDIKGYSREIWAHHIDTDARPVNGELDEFVVAKGLQIVRGHNANAVPDVLMDRTLMLMDDYVLDIFWCHSDALRTYDWTLYVNGNTVDADCKLEPMAGPIGDDWGYEYLDDLSCVEGHDLYTPGNEESRRITLTANDGSGLSIASAMPVRWHTTTGTGFDQPMAAYAGITKFIVSRRFPHANEINPRDGEPGCIIQRRHARTTCFTTTIERVEEGKRWIEGVKLARVFVGREPIPHREADTAIVEGGGRRDVILRATRDGLKEIREFGVAFDAKVGILGTEADAVQRVILMDGRCVRKDGVNIVRTTEPVEALTVLRTEDGVEVDVKSHWACRVFIDRASVGLAEDVSGDVLPKLGSQVRVDGEHVILAVSPGKTAAVIRNM